jgi:TIR domain/Bacterial SH3 domain
MTSASAALARIHPEGWGPMSRTPLNPRNAEVFISYAQDEDGARAVGLADRLEQAGASVWIAERSIEGAQNYGPEIIAAIRACKVVVLLCSKASLGSEHVAIEIELAFEAQRPRLPLLLEQTSIPDRIAYWLTGAQRIDISGPVDQWLPRVVRALQRLGVEIDTPEQPSAGDGPPPVVPVEQASSNGGGFWSHRRRLVGGVAALAVIGIAAGAVALSSGGGHTHVSTTPTKSPTTTPAVLTSTSRPPPKSYSVTSDLTIHAGPGTSYGQVGSIPNGTSVPIQCYSMGEDVNGPFGLDAKWDRITFQGTTGFVTDEYVNTQADEHNGTIPIC